MILCLIFQSPDSDLKYKSKDSLSSGIHLTMSMSPESAPLRLPSADLAPPQLSEAQEPPGLHRSSQRFPSLPEHLEMSAEAHIQRHISDPLLPGS